MKQMVRRIGFLMLGCKRLLSVYRFTCFQNENTPLKLAAEKGHINIVQKLISMKADVNKADKVIVSLCIHYVITFFIVLKGSPEVNPSYLIGSYLVHILPHRPFPWKYYKLCIFVLKSWQIKIK